MSEAFLEHANGDKIGELIRLDCDEIFIGRMNSCGIVTEPKITSVSPRHAIVRKTKDGWALVDVGTHGKGSTYGTYVNDARLEPNMQIILQPGDEIRLGTELGKYLRFLGEGTMPAPEPIRFGERLRIDVGRRCLLLDKRKLKIHLTHQEFELVLMLWQKSGEVCTFIEICNKIWPKEKNLSPDTIDADLRVRVNTLVHTLRRKITPALGGIDMMESYHGIGYRMRF